MQDLWLALAALAAVTAPLALAWWLMGRPPRPRREGARRTAPRGKMPDH